MKILDLCSGTGSATKPFKDRGHEVITIDMFDKRADILADICYLPVKGEFDFIWMSPPCTEFTLVNWRLGKCKDRKPDLSVIKACFELVDQLKPTYWMIENPRACMRHFIGLPQKSIYYSDYGYKFNKPTDLWGLFPDFPDQVNSNKQYKQLQNTSSINKDDRHTIPYNLGLSICIAIENEL